MIQFEAMRRLRRVYEEHGLRGSFNAEVMQQLAHLRLGREHPELGELATEWEAVVCETYSQGHDVELHVHPQWSDSVYADGRWELRAPWSILDYSAAAARSILKEAKEYLEGLLRPLDGGYRCVSFRSGSWCIAPSDHLLSTLSELGVVLDTSVAAGLFYDSPHVALDYREIDEPFLPYYPALEDARRDAAAPQPIVCVPTHTFKAGLGGFGLRFAARAIRRRTRLGAALTGRFVAPRDFAIPHAGYDRREYFAREWGGSRVRSLAGSQRKVSDLCGLSFFQTREMLRDIRTRARRAGVVLVPIIIENHSKDVGDIAPLALFAREVAAAPDVEVITLSELARNLEAGAYAIRSLLA